MRWRLRQACFCSSHSLPYVRPSVPHVGRRIAGHDGQRHCDVLDTASTWQYSLYDSRHSTPPHVALPTQPVTLNVRWPASTQTAKKVKAEYSSSCESISELRGVTYHMGSHSVTCHLTQVNAPRHNPSQPGQYSIYPTRRDGRLSGYM